MRSRVPEVKIWGLNQSCVIEAEHRLKSHVRDFGLTTNSCSRAGTAELVKQVGEQLLQLGWATVEHV